MISTGAKKSLGQNFLIDQNIARKIIAYLDLGPLDLALEIGPGKGILTRLMARDAGRVLALEKDASLAFGMEKNSKIFMINMDALHLDWRRLDRRPGVKIAGNLPYNIAQVLLWDLVSKSRKFARAVFMLQKEVAQRITSAPGSKEYGALSVWIQSYVQVRLLFNVPPWVFRPRPKVHSSVIELTPLPEDKFFFDSDKLSQVIKIMFQNRRKQLGRILKTNWNNRKNEILALSYLDAARRPEQLSPQEFHLLSRCIFRD